MQIRKGRGKGERGALGPHGAEMQNDEEYEHSTGAHQYSNTSSDNDL